MYFPLGEKEEDDEGEGYGTTDIDPAFGTGDRRELK